MSRVAVIVVAFLAPFLAAPANSASLPRLGLLPEVAVTGASLSLCDLLPPDASAQLRSQAMEISLGASPQPGARRVLDRDFVDRAIAADLRIAPQVAVPERVLITRNVRLIDLQDVFQAVRGFLKARKSAAADSLGVDDLALEAQVFVGPGDPGLRVLDVSVDAARRYVRWKLSASNDPEVLPFYAGARIGDASLFSPRAYPRTASASVAAAARKPQRESLIAPGQRATLNLQSDALEMVLDVLCLDRGGVGQQVRVRLESGKILTATVDGPAHVSGRL